MLNAIAEAEGWSAGWPAIEAVATIFLVIATLVVAVIALFPEWTHGRFYYPEGLLSFANSWTAADPAAPFESGADFKISATAYGGQ
jgi:hypothetical protein